MNFAEIVIKALHIQPVTARIDHSPGDEIVERCSPQHRLLATSIHRDVATDGRRILRGWIYGKCETLPFGGFGDSLGHNTSTDAYGLCFDCLGCRIFIADR